MTKLYSYAGIAASVVLIALGIGATYMGIDGRDRVRDDLAREMIVGTPDSTIPNQKVDTGSEAQAFAAVIRKHTLEATGGRTRRWTASSTTMASRRPTGCRSGPPSPPLPDPSRPAGAVGATRARGPFGVLESNSSMRAGWTLDRRERAEARSRC